MILLYKVHACTHLFAIRPGDLVHACTHLFAIRPGDLVHACTHLFAIRPGDFSVHSTVPNPETFQYILLC